MPEHQTSKKQQRESSYVWCPTPTSVRKTCLLLQNGRATAEFVAYTQFFTFLFLLKVCLCIFHYAKEINQWRCKESIIFTTSLQTMLLHHFLQFKNLNQQIQKSKHKQQPYQDISRMCLARRDLYLHHNQESRHYLKL